MLSMQLIMLDMTLVGFETIGRKVKEAHSQTSSREPGLLGYLNKSTLKFPIKYALHPDPDQHALGFA